MSKPARRRFGLFEVGHEIDKESIPRLFCGMHKLDEKQEMQWAYIGIKCALSVVTKKFF